MRPRNALLACCCALLLIPIAQAADNQQQLRDRLQTAAKLSSLDDPSLQPWHWKLEATLYNRDGKNPVAGALEIWFRDGDMRTTATLGSDTVTVLRKGNALYTTGTDLKPILSLAWIETEALHPISGQALQQEATINLEHRNTANVQLDCISPVFAASSSVMVSVGRPFSFCLQQGTPKLVVTMQGSQISLLRTRIGSFQSRQIPIELEAILSKHKIAEARTTSLSTQPDDPALFTVTSEMSPLTGPVDLKRFDQNLAPLTQVALIQTPPLYPPEVKQEHLTGTIVFEAMIGKGGRIHSLHATHSDSHALEDAEREALNTWLFVPLEINGVSLEFEIKLSFTFDL